MRVKWWFYSLCRVPGKVWAWIQNLYWEMMFRFFLPTVWVQPNMRAGLIEFIQDLRRAQSGKKETVKEIEAKRNAGGPLTHQEGAMLLEYIFHGHLPYPTVEEAIQALPRRGGTIRCGPGMLYVIEPLVFPSKAIRLIGGSFAMMGRTGIEASSGSRSWFLNCAFWGDAPGPRDWSPRGEIITRDGPADVIRMNIEL